MHDYTGALQAALAADLGFHGADTRHFTHGWHPFPAKFPPQLPQFFIERLSAEGETVLDPMFGSGTTVLEAVRLGRRTVGCDIDPLARLIAEGKLAPLDPMAAMEAGLSTVESARRLAFDRQDHVQQLLDDRFDAKTKAFVDYWFLPQQQLELSALLATIEPVEDEGLRKFLRLVLSSTIIAKSGGVSLARDLAHTRPHRVKEKQPESAFAAFGKRLKSALANAPCAPIQRDAADIRATSADDTGLAESSVDLIVTSPPYANNAIDYMRAHKFSLVWFGWSIGDLSAIRSRCLGHDAAQSPAATPLPQRCEDTIDRLAAVDGKKAAALRRYFCEMTAVIEEMRRVLKPGRAAVIVVGTSTLRGIDVETHKGLAAVGEQAGFHLAGIGTRRLDRDRRMMPARWGQERKSQIEQRMHEEYVIGLLKP